MHTCSVLVLVERAAGMSDATSHISHALRVLLPFLVLPAPPRNRCAPSSARCSGVGPPLEPPFHALWAIKMDKASNGPIRGDHMPTPLSELQRVAQRTSCGRVHQFTRASWAQRRRSHEAAPPSPPRMPPRPYTRQVAQRALAIISRSGTNTTSIGRQHYHKWCIGACGIGGFRVAVCVWGWFSRGIGNANCG